MIHRSTCCDVCHEEGWCHQCSACVVFGQWACCIPPCMTGSRRPNGSMQGLCLLATLLLEFFVGRFVTADTFTTDWYSELFQKVPCCALSCHLHAGFNSRGD